MMRQYLLAHLRVIIPVGLLAVMSLSVVAGIGYLRAFPWQPHSVQGKALANLTQYVNPFIGTAPADAHNGRRDDRGDTFPGATYPLGMVQWSPDTSSKLAGGYVYSDTQIDGFSLTHFSGRGCIVYQDIPFMPYLGDVTQSPVSDPSLYVARFSHSNEQAQPGYYRVGLPDLNTQVELTVTPHTGMGRFTFPATAAASLLINASGSINGVSAASVSLVPGQQEVIGSATSTIGCGHASYTIYFAARFDQAFSAYGVWNGANVTAGATSGAGASVGAYVTFDTSQQQIVMASVGISFVSVANAEDNLARENPQPTSQQFDALRQAANSAWNTRLNSILIGSATPSQLSVFYTALYHIFLQPNIFSDANGQYIGFDGKVHTVATGHAQYENISTWDGYRCQIALLALLAPSVASDIAQSLVNDAQQGDGHLPRWEQANSDSYGMVGDGADVYIATAYAFGATQFDTAGALYAMVTCSPRLKGGGFSDNAQGNPSRLRLTGLPSPQYVFGGVLVAVYEQPTGRANVGTHGQALGHTFPTAAAVLAGVLGRNRLHSLASVCCFACEDGTKLTPACIRDAFGEVVVPHHIGDLQLFEIDHIVLTHEHERRLVVKITSLAFHVLGDFGSSGKRFPAPVAALLATRNRLIGALQAAFTRAKVTRIVHHQPLRRDQEHLQSDIDARLLSSEQQRLDRDAFTRDAGVPPIRLTRDRDRFGRAF